ncbi:ABC transporter, periplasmic binding protein precursor [Aromatoleum aromaticum EbN1]|uniref:ABC transporter, periplasmic binding protein n=1 Tax=Aromatoleum aromaticum (strain DSM 19018 / LMG 30748 / EbN1) TaxID=76114 RepID=Q5P6F5_AROAE|nr:metal ABC transporter substrate-binding protein [Aromatoleum aromaticum]CAI07106.1 ABC transporter, periplasmic binding protein precursor [Aromatoleum aromaticum EbN1]
MNHLKIALLAALALGLALAAPALRAAPLEVVASFSILGDFVTRVGGERVAVTTLVGAGADAHNYQPRPSDARRLGNARLIVANGLGFDAWIERLAQSAGYRGRILIASAGIRPLAEEDEHGHAHEGAVDPHAWQDVSNAIRYVANIAEALSQADPAGAAVYRQNAARYIAELEALDATIRRTLATVPAERRKVVSSHDAFGYFSHAYDVRFLAAAGVSTQSEPSAGGIAQLIRQLRREKAPAVFVESISDPRLAERISHESGARLGGMLYSDALSNADGPAPTYLDMMRHNLETLIKGLAPPP